MLHKTKILQPLYTLLGLSLFLLPLIHAWMIYPFAIESSWTNYSALGGILPWSDAQGYYSGASHFLEGGILDSWSTRRPLNAILFSMRLWLSNNDFKIALIMQALLCGASCLLVARSIICSFGKIAGLAALCILAIFASVFIPTTLSETLGLTIGCLAFVFLWEGVQSKKSGLLFSAGLLLIMGLNARAGAFFVVPLLILWLGYHFRNLASHQRFNWKISSLFTLGVLCGFIFNILLIKLYADPVNGGAAHSNFATVLFGLVSGGKGWFHVYSLPEISGLSETEQANFLYAKSWEVFKAQPWNLLLGILRGWAGLMKGLLSFFQLELSGSLKILVRVAGAIVLFFGLRKFIRLCKSKSHRTEFGLLSVMLLGMFLSGAGIWTDGGFRVFAVTVPFFAAAVAIVFSSFFATASNNQESFFTKTSSQSWHTNINYFLSYTLLATALLGPLFIHAFHSAPERLPEFSCPKHETSFVTKQISGSPYIKLKEKGALFKESMLRTKMEDPAAFLSILEPNAPLTKTPAVLGIIRDAKTGRQQYVIAPTNIFANPHPWVGLCATKIPGNDTIIQIQSFEVLK